MMEEEEIKDRANQIYMAMFGSYDNERNHAIPILIQSIREIVATVELRILKQSINKTQ